eukprot:14935198-Ditylum_brightwellii.AAC.1
MDELFHNLHECNIFVAMIQETWLTGENSLKSEGYTLIFHGLALAEQSRRGSQGVTIALSPQAMDTLTQ